MKFRNCFFEFAGVYSGKYNLRLVYVENSNHHFDSGGGFDFKFGQIPYYHEQLYYGKDYSANPLQFEIEVLNVDGYISESQMVEIKEWLFGGTGWKKFIVKDGRTTNKSLRCILTPITDITEGNHYKGLRFSLRNASPFWYGEEKSITINNDKLKENVWWDTYHTWDRWCTFEIDIPNNGYVDVPIFPIIEVRPQRNNNTSGDGAWTVGTHFALSHTPAKTLNEGKAHNTTPHEYNIEEDFRVSCSLEYMKTSGATTYSYTEDSGVYTVSVNGTVICTVTQDSDEYKVSANNEEVGSLSVSDYSSLDETYCKPVVAALNQMGYRATSDTTAVYALDELTINPLYAVIDSKMYPDLFIPVTFNSALPKNIFRLNYGKNICRIYFGHIYESMTIRYTPMYRMGAF